MCTYKCTWPFSPVSLALSSDKGILKRLCLCITISRYFEYALVYDSICFVFFVLNICAKTKMDLATVRDSVRHERETVKRELRVSWTIHWDGKSVRRKFPIIQRATLDSQLLDIWIMQTHKDFCTRSNALYVHKIYTHVHLYTGENTSESWFSRGQLNVSAGGCVWQNKGIAQLSSIRLATINGIGRTYSMLQINWIPVRKHVKCSLFDQVHFSHSNYFIFRSGLFNNMPTKAKKIQSHAIAIGME